MFKCLSAYNLIPQLPCYYPLHIILFLHMLSTNHECTQPCYFPLASQTYYSEGEDRLDSLTRTSRLCAASVAIPVILWSLPLFCFA
jgi:hypothetical protein